MNISQIPGPHHAKSILVLGFLSICCLILCLLSFLKVGPSSSIFSQNMFDDDPLNSAIIKFSKFFWIGWPITGAIAWIFGNSNIKAMRQGTMDVAGLSKAETGKTLGMISTILFLCIAGICVLLLWLSHGLSRMPH